MNQFTIKDIESLSGIKAHTLRIWEKRYGIISPKRKDNKQRFYDNEDLKLILRITHLYNNGHKISAIANMQQFEASVYDLPIGFAEEAFIKLLIEASIDIDERLFTTTLNKAMDAFDIEECMIKVVYPYFEKIGMLWMNNKAFPAQERFASNIILKRIVNEIDKLTSQYKPQQPGIILFTPLREYHEIPLLFMHYLLKKNSHAVYYLGTHVSFDVLETFLKINKAEVLFFHVITNLTHHTMNNYVQQLTQHFSNHTIIMSGKLTETVTVSAGNLKLLHSVNEMIEFGKNGFIS